MKLSKKETAANKKAPAAKTAKRNVKAKPASARKAPAAAKVFANFPKGATAYEPIAGKPITGAQRRVLIVAAMVATGFAKLNKASIAANNAGNPKLFMGLVGATPYRYHKSNSRVTESGLTNAGVEWFTARFHGEDDYKLAADMVNAMQKGGTVDGLKFDRAIAG